MRILIILFGTLLLYSCKPNMKDAAVIKLYDEVMVIHDEVMPEISTINKLQRKLRKLPEQDDAVKALLKDLEDGDDAMMDWMSDFQVFKKMEAEPKEKKISYLENEKVKITAVSQLMKKAINNAQKHLNE